MIILAIFLIAFYVLAIGGPVALWLFYRKEAEQDIEAQRIINKLSGVK